MAKSTLVPPWNANSAIRAQECCARDIVETLKKWITVPACKVKAFVDDKEHACESVLLQHKGPRSKLSYVKRVMNCPMVRMNRLLAA